MIRLKGDVLWMAVAKTIALSGTCARRQVGAVVVLDSMMVSTGYNGAPRGDPHCLDVGCELVNGHCVRTVHAELNALLQAGLHGRSTRGATLYTTASPCRACMAAIMNCGVARVVYAEPYVDQSHGQDCSVWALDAAKRANIKMEHWEVPL